MRNYLVLFTISNWYLINFYKQVLLVVGMDFFLNSYIIYSYLFIPETINGNVDIVHSFDMVILNINEKCFFPIQNAYSCTLFTY